jgi:hypothetical protein
LECLNAAAVRLNDAPRGGQSQTVASWLGGVVRLKGMLAHLEGQAWSSVFHIDSSALRCPATAIGLIGDDGEVQGPCAVFWQVLHGLHCIQQQIE